MFIALKDVQVYLLYVLMLSFLCQLEAAGINTGLLLLMEDKRMVDILFNIGSTNSTVILVASLWQQMKLLQRLVPPSLQVHLIKFFFLSTSS